MKPYLYALLIAFTPAIALANAGHGQPAPSHTETASHEHGMQGMSEHAEDVMGAAGNPAKANTLVRVTMADTMRFTPSDMTFKAGDTVRFLVTNQGKIRHEMILGTMDELEEHRDMMRNNPGMRHKDAKTISLSPGESGEIVWQFTRPGKFNFACLVPGHMEAGMVGRITVR